VANFNRVFLMGNLTRDIELKYTPGNLAIAKIGLAVNRRYRTADGEDREETTFVDCDAFGKTAETMSKYLAKGRPVFIEGRLKLDQWEDKEGNKRSKMSVVVEGFQFIDSRPGGGGGGSGGGSSGGESYSEPRAARPAASRPAGGAPRPAPQAETPVGEDDIPF
jgi:single-strand DNA-binding protein